MGKKQVSKKSTPAGKAKTGMQSWYYPAGIVLLTFIVFNSILSGDFVNWDDPTFVLGNKYITSLSGENIVKMFSTFFMGNYCPLTIFTYAVDYHFAGGLHPFVFHLTSLLIHLVNTFLVYQLIYQLSNKQIFVAAVTSLLFAIHPMHIESVAWVSERRDVLYAMFYLLGLVSYVRYLANNQTKHLVYTLLFFLCSLFSKGQAVTFPLALLIIDYIYNRNWNVKTITEKIPFFILSLVFGYIAVIAQKTTPSVNVMQLSLINSLCSGNYGLLLYLIKSLVPFKLSGYHPYPFSDAASIPIIIYIAPVIILAVIVAVYLKLRSDKVIIGGLLFFLFTILPVLQFLPVGETIISERYTYVPYIGLFFVIAHASRNPEKYSLLKPLKSSASFLIIGLTAVLVFVSFNRVGLWKDSVKFWTDVIEKYPDSKIAYNNRGYMYNQFGQHKEALEDFNKGIALDSTYGRLYLNRGLSYQKMKMFDAAMADYTLSIKLDTTEQQTFLNRGSIYTDELGKYDSGIADFKRALKINPDNMDALTNLGVSYFKKGDYQNSILQYDEVIRKTPADGKAYYFRALAYAGKQDYDKAISDALKGKELGYSFEEAILKQWEQMRAAKQ